MCADSAPTVAEAGALAAACGRDVVVSDLVEPWSTTSVRANGLVEWTSSIEAERGRDAEGRWVPVDSSFTAAEGGRIGLAAPSVSMSFSDGTPGQPLAVMGKGDHALVYDLPFALPTPTVDAESGLLTYAGVADGIDLVVTVAPDGSGFTEVLRVATPEALAKAGLTEFALPVELSDGLSWQDQADGSLYAVDLAGTPVFVAPQPVVWDSAAGVVPTTAGEVFTGEGAGDEQIAEKVRGRRGVVGADLERLGKAKVDTRQHAPVDGDRVRPLHVRHAAGNDDLILAVDDELLDDAMFPLYIDPAMTGSLTGRAYIQSGWPDSAHWNDTSSFGVGRCDTSPEMGCSRVNIYRSFFQFATTGLGGLAGADVLSATLTLYGKHSYSCTAAPVKIMHTGAISSGTTWNTRPADGTLLESQSLAHKDVCGNQRDIEFAVSGAVKYSADASSDQVTLGVYANDESTTAGWKRYEDPRLSVTYSRLPSVPTDTKISVPALACGTKTAPTYVNTLTPKFTWTQKDPDGGNVIRNFDTILDGVNIWNAPDVTKVQGSVFDATVPEGTLVSGETYEVKTGGEDVGGHAPPWGPMQSCWITVDGVDPGPPDVSSTEYPRDAVSGAVSKPGTFTLKPAPGTTDVVKFVYSFNTDALDQSKTVAAGASTSVSFAPTTAGSQRLVVQAVDRAGRRSEVVTYRFSVSFPTVAGYWHMDLPAGLGVDSSGGGHPLTISSSVSNAVGPLTELGNPPAGVDDRSLKFDAAGDTATTSGPVVDSSKDFTVSVFVRPETLSSDVQVAVSQDGTRFGAFKIGRLVGAGCSSTTTGCYGFWKTWYDTAEPGNNNTIVISSAPAVTGRWVHLTGIYKAGQMSLYVCDVGTSADIGLGEPVLAGTKPFAGKAWSGGGRVQVGRAMSYGAYTENWQGAIDDVRLYTSALDINRIRQICQGDLT